MAIAVDEADGSGDNGMQENSQRRQLLMVIEPAPEPGFMKHWDPWLDEVEVGCDDFLEEFRRW